MTGRPVLALGGGGMRGVAHLGVLLELERAGFAVSGIAGTSSGALMAALWLLDGAEGAIAEVRRFVASGAASGMPNLLEAGRPGLRGLVDGIRRTSVLATLLVSRSQLSQRAFFDQIASMVPERTVESLPVPFVAVATDTRTGREVHLARGSLVTAVAASSAMPGLVIPVERDGRLLQDGGAVAEIPVRAARRLGGPVVAVEVSEGMPPAAPEGDRFPRAMLRAAAMGWQALRERILEEADAVIAPRVNHLHWADFHAVDEAVEEGRKAALGFLREWRSGSRPAV